MALTPRGTVVPTVPVTRPRPARQILWPTSMGYGDGGKSDSSSFPSLNAIKARQSTRPPEALAAFIETAHLAQDRILVLDDFLFKPLAEQSRQHRYDQILDWLPDGLVANDIRFLTNAHEDEIEQSVIRQQFESRISEINQRSPRRLGLATVEIKFSLGKNFPYVHDRFAIIDDELWHFGATVGGLHHLVNAATRGWDAKAHDAQRFFDEAWRGDRDASRWNRHG